MKANNLTSLLSSFSKDEVKEFRKFLESPLHNGSGILLSLYDEIIKDYPAFVNLESRLAKIFSKVYQDKNINDALIRKNVSNLTKLAEKYITLLHFQNDEPRYALTKLWTLKKRKLEALHRQALESTSRLFDERGYKLEFKYFLNVEKSEHHTYIRGKLEDGNRLFPETSNSFVVYAFNKFVDMHDKLFSHSSITGDYPEFYIEYLFNSIDLQKFASQINLKGAEGKMLNILILMIAMPKKENVNNKELFIKLRDAMYDYFPHINKETRFGYLVRLRCYCEVSYGKTDIEFWNKEEFKIYKYMLENKIFEASYYKYFMLVWYRSIASTAIAVKEYKWAEKFIEEYYDKMNPEERDGIYKFSKGLLRFHQGVYEETMKLIEEVDFVHFRLKFDVRILKLKVFYELGYFENARYLIDAFRHMVKVSNNINENTRKRINLFLKYYNKLLKIKESGNYYEVKLMQEEVKKKPNCEQIKWINESLTALMVRSLKKVSV